MVAASPNGTAHGYLPSLRPRWRWVEFDDGEAGDGEPFRAEIRTNLTWAEIDELAEAERFVDVWARLAPYVRAWNALGIDAETGEPAPVPPPAVAGPDAFRCIDAELTAWLWLKVRSAHLGDEERGKGGRRRNSTPATPSGSG